MNTYKIGNIRFTTVHDLAAELSITRQGMLKLLAVHKIPRITLSQGKKNVATLVEQQYIRKILSIRKRNIAKRKHPPRPNYENEEEPTNGHAA